MPNSNTNEFNLNDDQIERLAEAIVEKLFIKQEEADAKFLADLEESNANAQIYVVNNDGSVLSELEQQIKLLEQEFEAALKKELYNTAADIDLKLKILKKKLKDDETN
jgi:molybdopterin converting factor small subunit